MKAIIRKT